MHRPSTITMTILVTLTLAGAAHAQQATSLDRCLSALSGDVLRFVEKAGKCVRKCEDAKRSGRLGSDVRCRRPSNHAPTQQCLLGAQEQISGSKAQALKRCTDDEVALFFGGTNTCPGRNESVPGLLQCLAKRGESAVETLARKIYHPRRDPICGDGSINGGEQCDPNASSSACGYPTPICHPFYCVCVPTGCGNGILDYGEDCDYGASPDGCGFGEFCNGACECRGIGSASRAFLGRSSDLFD